jgi:hypothetical protein
MKAVRTRTETREEKYTGAEKPKHKIGDYMRVYCGSYEGHCFYIKDVRYNYDARKFEYLYDGTLMGGWYQEGTIVSAGSRKGWHYDSQGYCDNPGRGY